MLPEDRYLDHDDGGNDDENPFPVGYKRPPREHQFKPGNKAGAGKRRPRSAKLIDEIIQKIINEKVEVTINGKRVRMSLVEAMLREVFMTNKRKPRDTLRLVDLIKQGELATQQDVKPATITVEFAQHRPKGLPGSTDP